MELLRQYRKNPKTSAELRMYISHSALIFGNTQPWLNSYLDIIIPIH